MDVRLHRGALWASGALIAAAAVFTVWLRWASTAYPQPTDCGNGPCTDTFLGWASAHDMLTGAMSNGALWLLLLPALIAAFVAGPMVGREMESGVSKLAWTQSVSPARWLLSKLTTAATCAVLGILLLMGVFRIGTSELYGNYNLGWPDRGTYELSGPAMPVYALFAVAVGALAGLLLRRAMLAMAAAGGLTGLLLYALGSIRWDLMPTRTLTGTKADASGMWWHPGPPNAFSVDQGVTNAAGERFYQGQCHPPVEGFSCPADTRITGWYVDYHPRSHFWYVQLIESGIVLALAAVAVYVSFRVLRRRTA